MGHFAKVVNGIVETVIVAEPERIAEFEDKELWIQTSYNTRAGVHYGQDGQPDGGVGLRKNYAKIGSIYDAERDAFRDPQPFDSWILNEDTCEWNPPVPYPDDGKPWFWDEGTTSWVLI
jgi:hypothetical protein